MSYKAFLSYSHTVDSELSAALQSALHRFAKPWNRLRAVRVFRDVSSLSATPALWPSVEAALSDSEFFLLLASPEAACSAWVRREVDWWLAQVVDYYDRRRAPLGWSKRGFRLEYDNCPPT